MQNKNTWYQILGVEQSATLIEIKKAYRSLSRKYHPDVSDHPDASLIMQELNAAYSVLSDEMKRMHYDIDLRQQAEKAQQDAYRTQAANQGYQRAGANYYHQQNRNNQQSYSQSANRNQSSQRQSQTNQNRQSQSKQNDYNNSYWQYQGYNAYSSSNKNNNSQQSKSQANSNKKDYESNFNEQANRYARSKYERTRDAEADKNNFHNYYANRNQNHEKDEKSFDEWVKFYNDWRSEQEKKNQANREAYEKSNQQQASDQTFECWANSFYKDEEEYRANEANQSKDEAYYSARTNYDDYPFEATIKTRQQRAKTYAKMTRVELAVNVVFWIIALVLFVTSLLTYFLIPDYLVNFDQRTVVVVSLFVSAWVVLSFGWFAFALAHKNFVKMSKQLPNQSEFTREINGNFKRSYWGVIPLPFTLIPAMIAYFAMRSKFKQVYDPIK